MHLAAKITAKVCTLTTSYRDSGKIFWKTS
nr:MAG TPA: hypothetical protein [Caudoviricetes sp.]